MPIAAPPLTNTALWDRLRATFARVIAVIGAPAAIVLLTLSTRSARLGVVRQLAMLESLVRKLLFAEIAALAPASERGPRIIQIPVRPGIVIVNPRRQRAARKLRQFDLAHPESWPAPSRWLCRAIRASFTIARRRAFAHFGVRTCGLPSPSAARRATPGPRRFASRAAL